MIAVCGVIVALVWAASFVDLGLGLLVALASDVLGAIRRLNRKAKP